MPLGVEWGSRRL